MHSGVRKPLIPKNKDHDNRYTAYNYASFRSSFHTAITNIAADPLFPSKIITWGTAYRLPNPLLFIMDFLCSTLLYKKVGL